MPPMVKESLWAPESTTKGLGELVLICVLVCNLATSLGRHSVPCAAPPAGNHRVGPRIPKASTLLYPSQFVCLVSASWRTWTTSVQNTHGQREEGGRGWGDRIHLFALREQVTG